MNLAESVALAPSGLILEFGVRDGTTLRQIASATPRPVYGFDWFWGLPEAWGDGEVGEVTCNGQLPEQLPANAQLIVGRVEHTVAPFLFLFKDPVGFVHFDMDLYNPTVYCLELLADRLRVGTVLVFDEIVNSRRNFEHEGQAWRNFKERHPGIHVEEHGGSHSEALVYVVRSIT